MKNGSNQGRTRIAVFPHTQALTGKCKASSGIITPLRGHAGTVAEIITLCHTDHSAYRVGLCRQKRRSR